MSDIVDLYLLTALQRVYKDLLAQPMDVRIRIQPTLVTLRDTIAKALNADPQDIQDQYEYEVQRVSNNPG